MNWLCTLIDMVVSLARAGMYTAAAFLMYEIATRFQ